MYTRNGCLVQIMTYITKNCSKMVLAMFKCANICSLFLYLPQSAPHSESSCFMYYEFHFISKWWSISDKRRIAISQSKWCIIMKLACNHFIMIKTLWKNCLMGWFIYKQNTYKFLWLNMIQYSHFDNQDDFVFWIV